MRYLWILVVVAGCGETSGGTPSTPDAAHVPTPDVNPPPAPVFAQTGYIKSTAPIHDAHFGKLALSGSGDTLVAAQYKTASVYAKSGNTWHVVGDLVPSISSPEYGDSVAMSNDGSTIAVGDGSGAVYMFRLIDAVWTQDARIDTGMATFYGDFPSRLALSSDGTTLVASARSLGTNLDVVRTYERSDAGWSEVALLRDTTDGNVGYPLALAHDASVLALRRAANDSRVDVYARAPGAWELRATLASPVAGATDFGNSISCSARCETIVIGSMETPPPPGVSGSEGPGAAYVFEGDGTAWTLSATLRAANANLGDRFGRAVAISADGSTIVVGAPSESSSHAGLGGGATDNSAPYAGAGYVFRRHLGSWWQVLYLKASNAERHDIFGMIVDLSDDGKRIVVAAPYENSAASGVDGDQADNSQPYAGVIYAFEGTY